MAQPTSSKNSRSTAKRKTAPHAEVPPLNSPQLYINRELSLLSFQFRVLEEAQNERNPLLERVKFLSIVGSNLDEFFMVRVAGLIAQVDAGILDVGPDGMHPTAQLVAIRREVKKLLAEAHNCLHDQLLPALATSRHSRAGLRRIERTAIGHRRRLFPETRFFRCSLRWRSIPAVRFRTSPI